jgi:hypothetical protein
MTRSGNPALSDEGPSCPCAMPFVETDVPIGIRAKMHRPTETRRPGQSSGSAPGSSGRAEEAVQPQVRSEVLAAEWREDLEREPRVGPVDRERAERGNHRGPHCHATARTP